MNGFYTHKGLMWDIMSLHCGGRGPERSSVSGISCPHSLKASSTPQMSLTIRSAQKVSRGGLWGSAHSVEKPYLRGHSRGEAGPGVLPSDSTGASLGLPVPCPVQLRGSTVAR